MCDHTKLLVGGAKYILSAHLLPHFPKPDIVICRHKDGHFIEPNGFHNYILGDIMYALKQPNIDWFSIVVVGWNNVIRGSSLPMGQTLMKQRHLKLIGYKPVLVIWNEYMKLSKNEKIGYILRKMNEEDGVRIEENVEKRNEKCENKTQF